MSTVAPSAPAPAAVDASASGAKGETADPAAFAAEFETALSTLTAAETPVDPDAAAAGAAALPDAAAPAAAAPAAPPALATPADPALAAPVLALAPTAPSETTEAAPVAPPVLAVPDAPAAPASVISELAAAEDAPAAALAELEAAAAAVPAPAEDNDHKSDDKSPDAAPDAAPVDAAPVLLAPLPVLAQPTPAVASAPAALPTKDGQAVSGVTAAAPDAAAPAAAPDAPAPAAPAPPPAVAALQAPDEVAAPAAPARAQARDLVGQLSRPLQGLRSFGDGTHVISISVTPDNLGPVAVRAHVTGDNIRIELVAPTDQARAAIKDILPDLRRDLAGSGGQATLDLSSGNQPSGRESAPRDAPAQGRATDAIAATPAPGIRTLSRTDAALDVLA